MIRRIHRRPRLGMSAGLRRANQIAEFRRAIAASSPAAVMRPLRPIGPISLVETQLLLSLALKSPDDLHPDRFNK